MKMSRLDVFLIIIPMKFVEDTVLKKTNERLDVPMTTQEYIKCFGCWLYMPCWFGISNWRYWWSTAAPSRHKGAYFWLNDYMSRNRFKQILSSIQHTHRKSEYENGFHLMRKWEEAWNKNMEDEVSPPWIILLDESMMEWLNKYCPGFMCVGRKPHPFGNERHTTRCALNSILFGSLIVEGKDRPKELGQKSTASLVKQLVWCCRCARRCMVPEKQ